MYHRLAHHVSSFPFSLFIFTVTQLLIIITVHKTHAQWHATPSHHTTFIPYLLFPVLLPVLSFHACLSHCFISSFFSSNKLSRVSTKLSCQCVLSYSTHFPFYSLVSNTPPPPLLFLQRANNNRKYA